MSKREKITIDEVIVVEGRDDTAAINAAVNAVTIETHGFGLSDEMWKKIDYAYKSKGIIVFTDPDYAGNNIRKKVLERYPNAKEAFLPQEKALKKNDIGIENAKPEDIVDALNKAHCKVSEENHIFTQSDMNKYRLCGYEDSKERRNKLGDMLGIGYANSKGFLKKINAYGITREEFEAKAKELK